jgi:hypothetical protein
MLDKGEPGADIIASGASGGAGRGLPDIDRTFVAMVSESHNFLDPLLLTVCWKMIV